MEFVELEEFMVVEYLDWWGCECQQGGFGFMFMILDVYYQRKKRTNEVLQLPDMKISILELV